MVRSDTTSGEGLPGPGSTDGAAGKDIPKEIVITLAAPPTEVAI